MNKGEAKRLAQRMVQSVEKRMGDIKPTQKLSDKEKKEKKEQQLLLSSNLSEELLYDKYSNQWFKKYNYTEIRKLGSGSFGHTSLVFDNNANKNRVLKSIKLNKINLTTIFNEIDILRKIARYGCKTNLLCYIDYFFDYSNNIMYIVTDTFENSRTLFDFIKEHREQKKEIEPYKFLKIMKGLLQALVYLHKIGVAHSDIKPENILINDNLEIQLIDFGISCIKKSCKVGGTVLYQSPELLEGMGGGSRSVSDLKKGDIFSMGIVFYLLANLSFPFKVVQTNYPLAIDNSPTQEQIPVVNLGNPMSSMWTLYKFYQDVGGYVKKLNVPIEDDKYKKKRQIKLQLKPNLIVSNYNSKYPEINKEINSLIKKMLDTNEDTRASAKSCMTKLNKILEIFNKQSQMVISPGIISPAQV